MPHFTPGKESSIQSLHMEKGPPSEWKVGEVRLKGRERSTEKPSEPHKPGWLDCKRIADRKMDDIVSLKK